ncbi:hypothetical protein ABBQ38_013399 [Trebouxia sp. C0009 RCD-2024]
MSEGRRIVRQRKVSTKIAAVTDADRRNAATARLEALETDHDTAPTFQDSDDEFVLEDSDEDEPQLGKSRGKKRGKLIRTRKTRGMLADKQKGPKSFAVMLEEAELDQLPPEVPSYLTAAVGPSKIASARKWCSVCGNLSPYTCPRCGSAFCSKKCYPVHIETRCLKFVT